jgi:hypothetical protein
MHVAGKDALVVASLFAACTSSQPESAVDASLPDVTLDSRPALDAGSRDGANGVRTFDGCVPDLDAAEHGVCGGGCVFPEFPRRCATIEDCAMATVPPPCCGGRVVGIRRDALDAFDAAFRDFMQLPACGCVILCAGEQYQTDDGKNSFGTQNVPFVACDAGECWTYQAPLDASADAGDAARD